MKGKLHKINNEIFFLLFRSLQTNSTRENAEVGVTETLDLLDEIQAVNFCNVGRKPRLTD